MNLPHQVITEKVILPWSQAVRTVYTSGKVMTKSSDAVRPPQQPRTPVRPIALYLPQYHPTPENDEFWGKGFTEWTNVTRAKPLYPGHEQPRLPGELGFYDLRIPEVRQAQADLARNHGIEAFCYYHYWFGRGRTVLDGPFKSVLESGEPDFPFCLCWANESWTGIWYGEPKRVLIHQEYSGTDDYVQHFRHLLPAFKDRRYMTVDGRPLFCVFKPDKIPDLPNFLETWRTLAMSEGLPGLHLVAMTWDESVDPIVMGFDGAIPQPRLESNPWVSRRQPIRWVLDRLRRAAGLPTFWPWTFLQEDLSRFSTHPEGYHPLIIHDWDNTPRSGANGVVLTGSTVDRFEQMVRHAVCIASKRPPSSALIFLRSWNEWAEGNALEPDARDGRAYLEALQRGLGPDSPTATGNADPSA